MRLTRPAQKSVGFRGLVIMVRISGIDIFSLTVPLKGSFRNSRLARTYQESVILKVDTYEGLYGLGNIDPDPGYSEKGFSDTVAAIHGLVDSVVGLDPCNIVALLSQMDRVTPGFLEAKAAIEMALFDIKGKALGVPVYSLLGGKLREEILLNGWIGILPPDEAAREAETWLARGFCSAKIKIGSGVGADRDRVMAVREAVGAKMSLRVDANEAYGVDDAIRLARALRPFDISLLEQPVSRHDLSGMARIRRATEIPVMADEAILGPETLVEVTKKRRWIWSK